MTDLINRADAIEAVMNTEPTVFDAQSLEPHQKTKDVIDALMALPSADAVSREFYEDAVKANIGIVIENRKLKEQIESAEAYKAWTGEEMGGTSEKQNVAYICDKRRCVKEGCSNCGRTTDIEHAKNFELINNTYYERR